MLIDGKKIAAEIFDKLSVEVKNLSKKPRMAAILVGNEGNGRKFLEVKKRAAEKVGIEFKIYEFPEGGLWKAMKVDFESCLSKLKAR